MLIAYRDAVQSGTISSSGWTTGGPVTNLQNRRLGVPAVRADDLGFIVDTTFDADYTVGAIALLAHTLNTGTTMDIVLRNSSNTIIFTDTVSNLWAPPAGSQFPRHLLHVLSSAVSSVRRMVLAVSGITAAGRIGRLWAGPIWRPTYQTAFGDFEMRTMDDSTLNRTQGQQNYADFRARWRQLHASIPALTEAEAIGTEDGTTTNLQDIGFELGRASPAIVIPSEASNHLTHKFGLYGCFAEPPPVLLLDRNASGRLYSTTFDVNEEL